VNKQVKNKSQNKFIVGYSLLGVGYSSLAAVIFLDIF